MHDIYHFSRRSCSFILLYVWLTSSQRYKDYFEQFAVASFNVHESVTCAVNTIKNAIREHYITFIKVGQNWERSAGHIAFVIYCSIEAIIIKSKPTITRSREH